MEFTKQDLVQCENLIKALRKGTFTLEGVEVLALSQAMTWLSKLNAVMAASLEPKPQMQVSEVKNPITPPAAPKPTRAPKTKKL